MNDKVDLFFVIKELDKNNLGIYESLADDEDMNKEFDRLLSWLLPQWMSASTDESVEKFLISRFNLFCNRYWFELRSHPELQAKLLGCCGPGKPVRHRFVKRHKPSSVPNLTEFLETEYVDIREQQVLTWCRQNTPKQVKEFAKQHGYQKKEIDILLKEHKKVIA